MPEGALPALISAIITLLTVAAAWFKERGRIISDANDSAQKTVEKVNQARTEYIGILEGQLLAVKTDLAKAMSRINVLEVSESNCQQERVALLAENGNLRRRVDSIEAKVTSMEKKVQ